MLHTSIHLVEKYDYLAEKFKIAYAFLRRPDLAELPIGVMELDQGVIAQIQKYTTSPAQDNKWETHQRFFDIQYVIFGQELFGMVSQDGLIPYGTYDAQKDIAFYKDSELAGYVLLKAGDLALVAPEDAHKPRCIAGEACVVKKIVVKVPV